MFPTNQQTVNPDQLRMAESKSLIEKLSDITECPICTDTVRLPKQLPCIHTFCLKCLVTYAAGKGDGDKLFCPVCRSEFTIPVGGLVNLTGNFIIEKLLDAQKSSKFSESSQDQIDCDICGCEKEKKTFVYCVECEEKMCEQCAAIHRNMKMTKLHQLIPQGSTPRLEHLLKSAQIRCDQHPREEVKLYCTECKVPVCLICFISQHKKHDCCDIMDVVNDTKKEIGKEIKTIDKLRLIAIEQSNIIDASKFNLERSIDESEKEIIQQGDDMKKIVDREVSLLLESLYAQKNTKLKEVEILKAESENRKISLDSFLIYSQEVIDKAQPCNLVRLANDLKVRANSLKSNPLTSLFVETKLSFIPSDFQESKCNPIGKIVGELITISFLSFHSSRFTICPRKNDVNNILTRPRPKRGQK